MTRGLVARAPADGPDMVRGQRPVEMAGLEGTPVSPPMPASAAGVLGRHEAQRQTPPLSAAVLSPCRGSKRCENNADVVQKGVINQPRRPPLA